MRPPPPTGASAAATAVGLDASGDDVIVSRGFLREFDIEGGQITRHQSLFVAPARSLRPTGVTFV